MAKANSDIYVATESFIAVIDGEEHVIRKDVTRVRAGHPLLKANKDRFKPIDLAVHYDVETASAFPGEKRG